MKVLESVRFAMQVFPNSFINHNNEIILIPKFNVYTLLDDVETDEDFKVKLCEQLSRDCCCALRYSKKKRLEQYWQNNTNAFNQICGTNFTVEQMNYIYTYLGNGVKHELARQFVRSGFDISVIEKYVQERDKKKMTDVRQISIECTKCGNIMIPIWFTEEEEEVVCGCRYKTGRKRRAVSHLECPNCFTKECVDDSFD